MEVKLIDHTGDDAGIVKAARVSTAGRESLESTEKRGLIRYLVREKHYSTLEHNSLTFFIEAPITVAREFMRHRTQSYNETSGRYKEMDEHFYYPPRERPLVQIGRAADYDLYPGTDEQYDLVMDARSIVFKTAWEQYQRQLEAGIAREVARGVLPLDMYTQFYATTNLRNLLQFLDLRTADDALWEIRYIANEMKQLAEPLFPIAMEAWDEYRAT